jgi:NitT/TauT family transport system ATP-binding protein
MTDVRTSDPEIAEGSSAVDVLRVESLRKVYNPGRRNEHVAVENVSFDVRRGEFVCIVGPSGAGKTTLLRCISGLTPVTAGTVMFEGRKLDRVPPELGLVFQDYGRSLYPWLTNAGNVELPLAARGMPKARRRERAREVLESVGLGKAIDQHPWELSGGMQQRVAIARALSYHPDLLIMDEPFASVDAQTRFSLEDLILEVRNSLGITVVLVTHDIDEAVYLADRIVVLSGSPSRVREVVDVPLPAHRSQLATRASTEFLALREHLLGIVMPSIADGS